MHCTQDVDIAYSFTQRATPKSLQRALILPSVRSAEALLVVELPKSYIDRAQIRNTFGTKRKRSPQQSQC